MYNSHRLPKPIYIGMAIKIKSIMHVGGSLASPLHDGLCLERDIGGSERNLAGVEGHFCYTSRSKLFFFNNEGE